MRCYFDLVSDGEILPDDEGVEISCPSHAHAEALKAIQEVRQESDPGASWDGWKLRVRDPGGEVILSLPLDPAAISET